jgi:hypothetical protein
LITISYLRTKFPALLFSPHQPSEKALKLLNMKKLFIFTACIILITLFLSFKIRPAVIIREDANIPASSYSSDVLQKWMELQIRLMSRTPAVFNGPFVRIYSYSGIIAYQSVFPGIPNKSPFWFPGDRLNQFPSLPQISPGKKYHWPSSLNAAMAFINRSMFPAASAEGKKAIDSLENAVIASFKKDVNAGVAERSVQFGLETAKKIFDWAEADGFHNVGHVARPPAGPGKWKPTPPNYAKPIAPVWGSLRTMVTGSTEKTEPAAPIPYSEDSSSAFYKEAKEVYEISEHMTSEQKQIALFWKEINPGFTAPGHWLNILRQIFQKEKVPLDKAVYTYSLTGFALNDAWISSWKSRYVYSVLRPVTYIRETMGHKEWLSFVSTPPHPEYTSGFAAMAGAVCGALASVFGNEYQLTDNSYVDAGLGRRTFYSFSAMAKEAGQSKIYGGIHFRFSVDAGLQQGKSTAENIVRILR